MNSSVRTIIVEDEPSASNNLINLLRQHAPSVEVVAVAENVSKAVEAIEKDRPELIFLDIQLGNETSFELLDQISLKDLHIIFVTAYNQHAVKAFQFSAVDYILKPINPVRLQDAIQKISYTETDTKGSHDA